MVMRLLDSRFRWRRSIYIILPAMVAAAVLYSGRIREGLGEMGFI